METFQKASEVEILLQNDIGMVTLEEEVQILDLDLFILESTLFSIQNI